MTYPMLPLRTKVDLGVMSMKRYFIFLKGPRLTLPSDGLML